MASHDSGSYSSPVGGQPMAPSMSTVSQNTITNTGSPLTTTTTQTTIPSAPTQPDGFHAARRRDSFSSLRQPIQPGGMVQNPQMNGTSASVSPAQDIGYQSPGISNGV